MCLSLSGSLSSLKATLPDTTLVAPDTPAPERSSFKKISGSAEVIFFDFDGTLTATPGDRQVRSRKQAELCERAHLLAPHLRALREAGAQLGIISKSTEVTIRGALAAAGLESLFELPIVGKAVGFEGKVGFILEMSQKGQLKKSGNRPTPGPKEHRILLVDDDVLELERAAAQGLLCYAAPAEGGLQEEDFDTIERSLRMPPAPPRQSRKSQMDLQISSNASVMSSRNSHRDSDLLLVKPTGGKWRNLILFSGECFEG